MHAFVIAGTHSGCGKTTVTLGVLAALKKKGLAVQSFKTGPDFIDSGIHRLITGRPSRNLDLWMCGEEYVKDCFERFSTAADVAVVEGVMGLYDGRLSTASLAAFLDLPVILVVDAYGMAESAGAIVKGFRDWGSGFSKEEPGHQSLNPNPFITGVIFNRVASERHYERLRESVKEIPVLGYLPRDLSFEIPHRHLGLTVAEENPISDGNLDRLADTVLRFIDIEAIMRQKASERQDIAHSPSPIASVSHRPSPIASIAVAYDRAFCFYYEDNLDLLRDSGTEVVKFSPLADLTLPEGVHAVYIGGGYPELYAKELSANRPMLEALRRWAGEGRPLYAECGGLMYLSRGIYDFEGAFFPMAGVFPFETVMKKGRSRLGYREILLNEDCLIGKKGDRLRGHEFHYSEIKKQDPESGTQNTVGKKQGEESPDSDFHTAGSDISAIYSVRDGDGREAGIEGYRFRNTLASYIHIHFGSNAGTPKNVNRFLNRINQNKKSVTTEARRKTKI